MTRLVHVCDVCGQEQHETNHWWTLTIQHRKDGNILQLAPLGSIVPQDESFDLCGMQCMLGKVSEYAERVIREAQAV